jgi:hypothetical protein
VKCKDITTLEEYRADLSLKSFNVLDDSKSKIREAKSKN